MQAPRNSFDKYKFCLYHFFLIMLIPLYRYPINPYLIITGRSLTSTSLPPPHKIFWMCILLYFKISIIKHQLGVKKIIIVFTYHISKLPLIDPFQFFLLIQTYPLFHFFYGN